MRTVCVNVSRRNIRGVRRPKPNDWGNRSRNLFRFTLRGEFSCRAIRLYSARDERHVIDWALGTIVVTGPKTLEFYEQFSNHSATLLRPDGKDILSVKMHLNSERQAKE